MSSNVDLLASVAESLDLGFVHLADRLEGLQRRNRNRVADDGVKENRRPFILSSLLPAAL